MKVSEEDNAISYVKAGFFIFVTFHEGKASQIIIMKGNPNAPEDMSEAERESLLKANAGAGTWKKKKQVFDVDPEWTNAEEKRAAKYSSINQILLIGTLDHYARAAAEKESSEKENLDGF